MSNDTLKKQRYDTIISQAREYLKNDNKAQALIYYQKAAEIYQDLINSTFDHELKRIRNVKLENIEEMIEKLIRVLESDKKRTVENKITDNLTQKTEKEVEIETESNVSKKFPPTTNLTITFDDVFGLDEVKKDLKEKIIFPFKAGKDLRKSFDIDTSQIGIFMYGPPGTGKTFLAAAMANELNCPLIEVKSSDILTSLVGESEEHIVKLFNEIKEYPRVIVFFDEIEALLPKNVGNSSYKVDMRQVFLTKMNGIETYQKNSDNPTELIFISASNKPWDVDPAALRAGRLGDYKLYVPLPDAEARKNLIRKELQKISKLVIVLDESLSISKLVELTKGFVIKDIQTLFKDARSRLAIEYYNHQESNKAYTPILNMELLLDLSKRIKVSVTEADLSQFRRWRDDYDQV